MSTKKMKYPKYRIHFLWSEEDACYVVNVPELPGCMTDGDTIEEAAKNAEEAIESYLMTLKDLKKEFPEPLSKRKFNGKVSLRMDADVHKEAFARALEQRLSLNQLIENAVVEKLKTG